MADVLLSTVLVLAVVAAVGLARSGLRHWWAEHAGRVYELPVDRRGTVLRAAAAGGAAVLAIVVAVPLLSGPGPFGAGPGRPSAVVAPRTSPSSPTSHPVPRPAPSAPSPTPTQPAPRTLSHPAGGTLQQFADGTRVWLPPQYAYRRAATLAFPVVIAHLPADEPDLYTGFTTQAASGKADPFLLVMPPACTERTDPAALLATIGRRYRILTGRDALAVIGVGDRAACAVRTAYAHPDRYAAVVGVSGAYQGVTMPAAAGRAPLLMISAAGETGPRASALRLRTTLHAPKDEVRIVDRIVRRRVLFATVAGYLTEKLRGPNHP